MSIYVLPPEIRLEILRLALHRDQPKDTLRPSALRLFAQQVKTCTRTCAHLKRVVVKDKHHALSLEVDNAMHAVAKSIAKDVRTIEQRAVKLGEWGLRTEYSHCKTSHARSFAFFLASFPDDLARFQGILRLCESKDMSEVVFRLTTLVIGHFLK